MQTYVQRRPCAALAPYIETLWYCEGYVATHRRERVLPNGRVQLLFDLSVSHGSSALLIGIRTTHTILETAAIQRVAGVVFRPGGTLAVLAPPASEFLNREIALDDIFSAPWDDLRDCKTPAELLNQIEANLLLRLGRKPELHAAVRFAVHEFGRDASAQCVEKLARDAGLSRRRFSGLFGEQVGLSPKAYCRLHRFKHVVRQINRGGEVNWAQLSIDGGYYDQAHMAHEFREFSGVSPGAWRASERPFLNHAVID